MDVKIINAFLTAGMDAFKDMFGIECVNKKPYILNIYANHPWEISGIIGATGEHNGIISFRLHKLLSKKMLELSGIEFEENEMEEMSKELVSEFTNVISGNAISNLSQYKIEITPPITVSGHNHEVKWPRGYPVVAIPFTTQYGSFEVNVCFK